jgi:CHASE2 domain-containing sensor protein
VSWRRQFPRPVELFGPLIIVALLGLALDRSRFGDGLARLSFDTPFVFRPDVPAVDVVVVTMNERTYDDPELNGTNHYPVFDRATHARFLEKLRMDGARVVVFDIFFKGETAGDAELARAITRHGKVILAAQIEPSGEQEYAGFTTNFPPSAFRDLPGCRIAHPDLVPDAGVVRAFPWETSFLPSIPMAAAHAADVPTERHSGRPRWIAYYGAEQTLPTETYQSAIARPPGYFRDKFVFIGGKPKIDFLMGASDQFNTPLTRWTGAPMRGVEVHATIFLNMLRNEGLTRMAPWVELLLIVGFGAGLGSIAAFCKPKKGAIVLLAIAVLLTMGAIILFWTARVWANWVLIAWVQAPAAGGMLALMHSRRIERDKEKLEAELESIRSNQPAHSAHPISSATAIASVMKPPETGDGRITIRDYELLRVIGEGAYGQVWLARTLIGGYRAIKVVYRSEDRPFEREFEGVRHFGEISGKHAGWVTIFHVGKDDVAGFFYYVMEMADDLTLKRTIDPGRYLPKTLGQLLVESRWLPLAKCIEIAIKLADALAALHVHGLVHRDLKPSNIIFVNDAPKLADIGLVARAGQHKSAAGTEDYIPPEGMGAPQADVFSLGRVIYKMATGGVPSAQPGMPDSINERKDVAELMELMKVVNTACERFQGKRYQSGAELRDELLELQRRLQRRLK